MRTITIELTLSLEDETEYATTCAELVVEDFVQQAWCAMRVVSDSAPPMTIEKDGEQ